MKTPLLFAKCMTLLMLLVSAFYVFSSEDDAWSVYPVPVDDEVTIRLSEKISGEVALQILNAQGQSIYSQEGIADAFRSYNLSARELGMNQGIFFGVLQQNNGRRSVKKVIKK